MTRASTTVFCIALAGLALIASGCGQTTRTQSAAAIKNPPHAPATLTEIATPTPTARPMTGAPKDSGASAAETARRFAQLTSLFEARRSRLSPAIRRQAKLTGHEEATQCAPLLGGAGSERAFGVGVESTILYESRLLLSPYTSFSRALEQVDTSDVVLARAARDTSAVRRQIASFARADDDPCRLARRWRATGWSRRYSFVSALSTVTASRISHDAATAAQQMTTDGVSPTTARVFAQDLNPTAEIGS